MTVKLPYTLQRIRYFMNELNILNLIVTKFEMQFKMASLLLITSPQKNRSQISSPKLCQSLCFRSLCPSWVFEISDHQLEGGIEIRDLEIERYCSIWVNQIRKSSVYIYQCTWVNKIRLSRYIKLFHGIRARRSSDLNPTLNLYPRRRRVKLRRRRNVQQRRTSPRRRTSRRTS